MFLIRSTGAFVALLLAPAALAAGDAQRGARAFRQCMACHSVKPGEHLTGPSLAHIWNEEAGTVEGFMRYTDALKRSGITWNETALDRWLADPAQLVPGTSMSFPGVKQRQAREDLIAYLKAADAGAAPAAKGGGGMMGMARRKPDLGIAPPATQVRSIRHCGDTYIVETGDGKVEKIWEFNLRFKTDTSILGPAPGRPVLVGAGMQGDRASIVFASPREMGESIREACP